MSILNNQATINILVRVARNLGAAQSSDQLLQTIVEDAMSVTNADGGTLYLVKDDALHFEIIRNNSLGIRFGGTERPIPDHFRSFPLKGGKDKHVCVHVIQTGVTANIKDAYDSTAFDFQGTRAMDKSTGYRSKSFLAVGLFDHNNEPVGVLQLLNATNPKTNIVQEFTEEQETLIEALAGMAAISINNTALREGVENLLEAFIQLIAEAIDQKSPYTGGHCRRVPRLVMDLARSVHETNEGVFADFEMKEEDFYELHVASWLHDIGKICIPEFVVDKATKLETIYDRIHEVRFRFELKIRELEVEKWKSIANGADAEQAEKDYQSQAQKLRDDFVFITRCNIGGEFMSDAWIDRLEDIAKIQVNVQGKDENILTDDLLYNLSIRRGTLTEEERTTIQRHIDITIDMLEKLPFPKHLHKVPEYAGGHHETMVGTGYPKGLTKSEMSVPARMMAIADIFEALTASDRPYKKAKSLSLAMNILGDFKKRNHIDPDLFDIFVKSKTYQAYAEEFLSPELIDEVDTEKLLAIQPDSIG